MNRYGFLYANIIFALFMILIYVYNWLTTDPEWTGDLFKHHKIYIFAYEAFLVSIGILALSEYLAD